jgi:hypothetical protein
MDGDVFERHLLPHAGGELVRHGECLLVAPPRVGLLCAQECVSVDRTHDLVPLGNRSDRLPRVKHGS